MSNPKQNNNSRFEDIYFERGDLTPNIVELDGLNLPTLFGEAEDFTNIGYDSNDLKYSDLFNEHGEVLANTLWSSIEPRDILVQDKHGCLMSVFDFYTVTVSQSPYGLLTEMSAPPNHHRSALTKTTVYTPQVNYACVACSFTDFKTSHSLRPFTRLKLSMPVWRALSQISRLPTALGDT